MPADQWHASRATEFQLTDGILVDDIVWQETSNTAGHFLRIELFAMLYAAVISEREG